MPSSDRRSRKTEHLVLPTIFRDNFPSSFLANKSLFPSRLSCENQNGFSDAKLDPVSEFIEFLYARILIVMLAIISMFRLVIKSPSQKERETVDCIVITHYTDSFQDIRNDKFLGSLATHVRKHFSHFTYLFNSSKKSPLFIRRSIARTFNGNFSVHSALYNLSSLPLIANTVLRDYRSARNIENGFLNKLPRGILNQVVVSQVSRSTMSILIAWQGLEDKIKALNPKFLVLPIEGNAHEIYFLHQLKNKHPKIKVVFYQHTPIVNDQPGFFRVISNMRETDTLLLSSSLVHKKIMAKSSISSPLCRILIIGSDRVSKPNIDSPRKKAIGSSSRKVLIAPEGTVCALEEMLRVIRLVSSLNCKLDMRLRIHPDQVQTRTTKKSLQSQEVKKLISTFSIQDDLEWAEEFWFRTTSLVDAAIRWQVTPIHINLESIHDLNPLRESFIEYKEIRDSNELMSHCNSAKPDNRTPGTTGASQTTKYLFDEISPEKLDLLVADIKSNIFMS